MKLRFLVLSLFVSLNAFADYNLRASYGFLFNEEISGRSLKEGSYDLYGEYYIEPVDKVSIGFGIAYKWPAEYRNIPTGLNSNPIDSLVPIYGTVLLSILPDSNIEPYAVGRFGFSIVNQNKNSLAKNVQGDLYTSIGLGGYYNDFFLEGTFDRATGYYNLGTKRYNMEYEHFTLRFGYNFNFISNNKVRLHDKQKEIINTQEDIPYDNLEKFDNKGNVVEKQGTYIELEDFQIIE